MHPLRTLSSILAVDVRVPYFLLPESLFFSFLIFEWQLTIYLNWRKEYHSHRKQTIYYNPYNNAVEAYALFSLFYWRKRKHGMALIISLLALSMECLFLHGLLCYVCHVEHNLMHLSSNLVIKAGEIIKIALSPLEALLLEFGHNYNRVGAQIGSNLMHTRISNCTIGICKIINIM